MNAFFQWIRRLFAPRKTLIESKPAQAEPVYVFEKKPVEPAKPIDPIDQAHRDIESTCHQIEQSMESIHSNIRRDKSNAEVELLRCKQLIAHLENTMYTQPSLNTE